jgi:hypothetical protein
MVEFLLPDPSLWADEVSGHHALMSHVDACFGLERDFESEEPLIVFGGIARNALPSTLILDEDDSVQGGRKRRSRVEGDDEGAT